MVVANVILLADAVATPHASYLLLAVMAVLAVGFALAPLLLSAILAPKKPGDIKESTFECGLEAKLVPPGVSKPAEKH